jgi:hypothetical protein
MPNLLAYLQHYFSPKITYYEGNGVGLRKDLQKPSVKGCWTDGSIDAETLGKFQLGYSPDFRAYGYDLMPPQMDEHLRRRRRRRRRRQKRLPPKRRRVWHLPDVVTVNNIDT